MPEWTASILDAISTRLASQTDWSNRLSRCVQRGGGHIHLAVFVEPFLRFVLDGTKKVESRFSVYRQPPYGTVNSSDVLLVKRSSGPVVAIAEISEVWYYELDRVAWDTIRTKFGRLLRINDADFWDRKARSCFATLMRLEHVEAIAPVPCGKRDRRAWVVF
jgi:hypothetical protein